MNGHYISIGSSIVSSGQYGGIIGLSYEYRYKMLGFFISGGGSTSFWNQVYIGDLGGAASAGVKLYLSSKKVFLRNLYFNYLPFSYWGYAYDSYWHHYKYHLFGMGLFFGYSPIWYVNKNMALGFNLAVGTKATYKFDIWEYINWDLGFVIKF